MSNNGEHLEPQEENIDDDTVELPPLDLDESVLTMAQEDTGRHAMDQNAR